jgi:hypothetical protein
MNDDRPGRPSHSDFSAKVSGYLERNLHAPYCKIAKELFTPKTTVSWVLEEIGSSYRLSRRQREWTFVKRCWRFWKSLVHDKRIMLLQIMNAELNGKMNMADNGQ